MYRLIKYYVRGCRSSIVVAIISMAIMTGCANNVIYIDVAEVNAPEPIDTGDLTGARKWTYEQLWDWYYWQDEMRAAPMPPNELTYDEFLYQMVLNIGDTPDADGTMDGGYYSDGQRYIYSYMTRYKIGYVRSLGGEMIGAMSTDYLGFGLEPFALQSSRGPIYFLITWTRPGGAADRAGLKRGMWITRHNGSEIVGDAAYYAFGEQLYSLSAGDQMLFTVRNSLDDEKSEQEYTLDAIGGSLNPIIYYDVITTRVRQRSVAYVVYNEFNPGGDQGYFDANLIDLFGQFKTRWVTDLVLDLRYNPGGDIACAQLLASLIGNVTEKDVFTKLQFNKTIAERNGWDPLTGYFYDESNSLKFRKVYILVTENSASASELVINSLRGVDIEVVLIGTKTEGKNVGMIKLPQDDLFGFPYHHPVGGVWAYNLWPISFKMYNAKNQSDFAGGFVPTYNVDEFRNLRYYGDGSRIIYPLGDPRESLLSAALTIIDGGTITPDPLPSQQASRAGGVHGDQPPKWPHNPRRSGAILYNLPM